MNRSNKGYELKKILVLFLAVFLLINNSINVFATGSWIDKTSEGYQQLYGNNADMTMEPSGDNMPTSESVLLELIGGALYLLAKGVNTAFKSAHIDLSIDGIVYGRTSGTEIKMDIARFGLEPVNPWGLLGASVYYNIRVISLYGAPLLIVMLLIVQLLNGELNTEKGRAKMKTVTQNAALYLLLLFVMPYIAEMALFFRDGLMVLCSDGLEEILGNMGVNDRQWLFQIKGVNGIFGALEGAYESNPSFPSAAALFATALAGIFYLWDYIKIALILTMSFGLFPVFILLYMWDQKKLSVWLDMFFPALLIPFVDMILLMAPAFISAAFSMVFGESIILTSDDGVTGLAIVLVAVIWSARAVRDYVIKKLGFDGLVKTSSAMGLLLMAGRMLASKNGGAFASSGAAKTVETASSATAKADEMGAVGRVLANSDRAINDLREPDSFHMYGERVGSNKTDEFLREDSEGVGADLEKMERDFNGVKEGELGAEENVGIEDTRLDGIGDIGTDDVDINDVENNVLRESAELDAPPESGVVNDDKFLMNEKSLKGISDGEETATVRSEKSLDNIMDDEGVEVVGTEKDNLVPSSAGEIGEDYFVDKNSQDALDMNTTWHESSMESPLGESITGSRRVDTLHAPAETAGRESSVGSSLGESTTGSRRVDILGMPEEVMGNGTQKPFTAAESVSGSRRVDTLHAPAETAGRESLMESPLGENATGSRRVDTLGMPEEVMGNGTQKPFTAAESVSGSRRVDTLNALADDGRRVVTVPRPKPISEGSTESKFVEGLSDRDKKRYDNLRKMDTVESQVAKNNDYINSVGYSVGAYQKAMQQGMELENQVNGLQGRKQDLVAKANVDRAEMQEKLEEAKSAKLRSDNRLLSLKSSNIPAQMDEYAAELEKNESIAGEIKRLEEKRETYDTHQKVRVENLDNEIVRTQNALTLNTQKMQGLQKAHELSQDNAFYGKHLDYHRKVESIYAENSGAAGMSKTIYRDADSFRRQKEMDAVKKEHMTLGNFESRSYDGILSPQEREKIYRQRAMQLASQERLSSVVKVAGIAAGTVGAIGGMYGGTNGMAIGATLGSGTANLVGSAFKNSAEQKVMDIQGDDETAGATREVHRKYGNASKTGVNNSRSSKDTFKNVNEDYTRRKSEDANAAERRHMDALERGTMKTDMDIINNKIKDAEDSSKRISDSFEERKGRV